MPTAKEFIEKVVEAEINQPEFQYRSFQGQRAHYEQAVRYRIQRALESLAITDLESILTTEQQIIIENHAACLKAWHFTSITANEMRNNLVSARIHLLLSNIHENYMKILRLNGRISTKGDLFTTAQEFIDDWIAKNLPDPADELFAQIIRTEMTKFLTRNDFIPDRLITYDQCSTISTPMFYLLARHQVEKQIAELYALDDFPPEPSNPITLDDFDAWVAVKMSAPAEAGMPNMGCGHDY